jgi:hypothetical protein
MYYGDSLLRDCRRNGPLAQLVERHVYTVDVIGSSPVGPTIERPGGVASRKTRYSCVWYDRVLPLTGWKEGWHDRRRSTQVARTEDPFIYNRCDRLGRHCRSLRGDRAHNRPQWLCRHLVGHHHGGVHGSCCRSAPSSTVPRELEPTKIAGRCVEGTSFAISAIPVCSRLNRRRCITLLDFMDRSPPRARPQ